MAFNWGIIEGNKTRMRISSESSAHSCEGSEYKAIAKEAKRHIGKDGRVCLIPEGSVDPSLEGPHPLECALIEHGVPYSFKGDSISGENDYLINMISFEPFYMRLQKLCDSLL